MRIRTEHKGFIVKVHFWGDSITPMYKYRLYLPRKFMIPEHVWTQDIHGEDIKGKITDKFDYVIDCFNKEKDRWK